MQQDAHEGLCLLLDQLNEAQKVGAEPKDFSEVVDGKTAWEQYTLRQNSSIVQMYSGIQRTVVTCGRHECGRESTTRQVFDTLQLGVPLVRPCIQDCLAEFISPTELSEYVCPECGGIKGPNRF